jgi:hypothetical protein
MERDSTVIACGTVSYLLKQRVAVGLREIIDFSAGYDMV